MFKGSLPHHTLPADGHPSIETVDLAALPAWFGVAGSPDTHLRFSAPGQATKGLATKALSTRTAPHFRPALRRSSRMLRGAL